MSLNSIKKRVVKERLRLDAVRGKIQKFKGKRQVVFAIQEKARVDATELPILSEYLLIGLLDQSCIKLQKGV